MGELTVAAERRRMIPSSVKLEVWKSATAASACAAAAERISISTTSSPGCVVGHRIRRRMCNYYAESTICRRVRRSNRAPAFCCVFTVQRKAEESMAATQSIPTPLAPHLSAARLGFGAAIATALLSIIAFARAVTTLPISGPMCRVRLCWLSFQQCGCLCPARLYLDVPCHSAYAGSRCDVRCAASVGSAGVQLSLARRRSHSRPLPRR